MAVTSGTVWTVPGAMIAMAAAMVAAFALTPRLTSALHMQALNNSYRSRDPDDTRKAVYVRRLDNFEHNKTVTTKKLKRLKVSIWLLATSTVLVVCGETVHLIWHKHT